MGKIINKIALGRMVMIARAMKNYETMITIIEEEKQYHTAFSYVNKYPGITPY